MPALANPRQESLAQALAQAGHKADRCRAVRRPHVALEKRAPASPNEVGRKQPDRPAEAGWGAEMKDALGTSSDAFVSVLLGQLDLAARRVGTDETTHLDRKAAFAVVEGVKPENEVEAMLAVQMVGTHALAMQMLARTNIAERRDAMNDYGKLAVKLLRTYTTQMEALARVRRKGEQTVRVEHVNVYPGGQAVVGNVSGRGGGGSGENQQQPHVPAEPRTLPTAPGVPLRRADEERTPVPIACRGR